jgi:hypothetical protein
LLRYGRRVQCGGDFTLRAAAILDGSGGERPQIDAKSVDRERTWETSNFLAQPPLAVSQ